MHIWDRIENDHSNSLNLTLLPKLANAAQSLPTSSADVEQTFSGVKLIKTLLRNKLSAENIEAILLIIQSYGKQRKIIIEKKLVQFYQEVSKQINERKRAKIRLSPVLEQSLRKEEGFQEKSREETKEEANHENDLSDDFNQIEIRIQLRKIIPMRLSFGKILQHLGKHLRKKHRYLTMKLWRLRLQKSKKKQV